MIVKQTNHYRPDPSVAPNQGFGAFIKPPFEDIAKILLQKAGLNVSKTNSRNSDMTLEILTDVTELGAFYSGPSPYSGLQYTGASVSGTITFRMKGARTYKGYFSGEESPVGSFESTSNPLRYSIYLVLKKSFLPTILRMLEEIYGIDSLISLLNDNITLLPIAIPLKPGKSLTLETLLPSGIRIVSAQVLGDLRDPRAVKPLIAVLMDYDENVRLSSLKALEALVGTLQDKRGYLQCIVAEALGIMLTDKDSYIYDDLRKVLRKIKDPQVLESLIACLNLKYEGGSSTIESIMLTLGQITGKWFGTDLEKWQKWWDQNKETFIKKK